MQANFRHQFASSTPNRKNGEDVAVNCAVFSNNADRISLFFDEVRVPLEKKDSRYRKNSGKDNEKTSQQEPECPSCNEFLFGVFLKLSRFNAVTGECSYIAYRH